MDIPKSFFVQDGEQFVPTGLGLSPWDKISQNGVSLSALVAHALELHPADTPMLTARTTLDIFGSVPMTPLTAAVKRLRSGPRFQLMEVELHAQDKVWVRASALRLRLAESPDRSAPLTYPVPDKGEPGPALPWLDGVRMKGDFNVIGAGAMWGKILVDVVEGHKISPMERVAIMADFCGGVAPLVKFSEWTAANLDIDLHLTRKPVGEWLLVDATSESAGNGIGVATARIGDRDGMFATAQQTVFLNKR